MKQYTIYLQTDPANPGEPCGQYPRLSDTLKKMKEIVAQVESDPEAYPQDATISILRSQGRKGEEPQENEMVHFVCGKDDDSDDFCYEGLYYLSTASDFERMIMMGESFSAWYGNYSIQVMGAEAAELCVFSHLEMILESIDELTASPDRICGRVLTISRKDETGKSQAVGQLLYTQNKQGDMALQHRKISGIPLEEEQMFDIFVQEQLEKLERRNAAAKEKATND